MLKQSEIEQLIHAVKHFVDRTAIEFPSASDFLEREVASEESHDRFLIDINRRGRVKPKKCTFQERYSTTEVIFRLDIDGPPHVNPDGVEVDCPHLHVYREGFGDKWAYPANDLGNLLRLQNFSDTTDLIRSFREFLYLCNIQNIPDIQASLT